MQTTIHQLTAILKRPHQNALIFRQELEKAPEILNIEGEEENLKNGK